MLQLACCAIRLQELLPAARSCTQAAGPVPARSPWQKLLGPTRLLHVLLLHVLHVQLVLHVLHVLQPIPCRAHARARKPTHTFTPRRGDAAAGRRCSG